MTDVETNVSFNEAQQNNVPEVDKSDEEIFTVNKTPEEKDVELMIYKIAEISEEEVILEGMKDGDIVKYEVGVIVGYTVGFVVGKSLGIFVGLFVGDVVGYELGVIVGYTVGLVV
eukprot:gene18564-24286_t